MVLGDRDFTIPSRVSNLCHDVALVGNLLDGVIAPVDGLLGLMLRAQNRWALCPENDRAFFAQNRELPSYILGDGKGLRQE